MNKNFKVENDSGVSYIVTFNDEDGIIKASCTCQAGQHCQNMCSQIKLKVI